MDPKKKPAAHGAQPTAPSDKASATKGTMSKEQEHPHHVLGTDRPEEIPELDEVGGGSMPSGTQTGQTGRGSYATDQSTGSGAYVQRTGTFGSEPVAQPGNDRERDPDEVDPQL